MVCTLCRAKVGIAPPGTGHQIVPEASSGEGQGGDDPRAAKILMSTWFGAGKAISSYMVHIWENSVWLVSCLDDFLKAIQIKVNQNVDLKCFKTV